MRFYNGTKASTARKDAADRLVRFYVSNVNKARRANENYGGSVGGRQSIDDRKTDRGLAVIGARQSSQADARRVFDSEGIGRFGANKESWIARQYDAEDRKAMQDRQFGRDEE